MRPIMPSESAGGHALAIIDGLIFANGGEEAVVLTLIHVVLRAAPGPVRFTFDARRQGTFERAIAIGTHDVIGVFVVAAFRLAIDDESAEAVRVEVIDGEMIINVAAFGRNFATAYSDATDRRFVFHGPGDFVHAMNGLFDDAIAAEPNEVVPVANLPLGVAHAGGTGAVWRHGFDRAGVVRGVVSDGAADGAIVHFFESGDDGIVIAPAEARDERKIFGVCFFGCGKNGAHTWSVGSNRLFAEYMFVGCNASFEMDWTETGGRGEDDDVDAGVDYFLIGVEA